MPLSNLPPGRRLYFLPVMQSRALTFWSSEMKSSNHLQMKIFLFFLRICYVKGQLNCVENSLQGNDHFQCRKLISLLTSFLVTLSQSRRANSSWMSARPLSVLGKSNTKDSLKTGLRVLFLTWVFFLEILCSLCRR